MMQISRLCTVVMFFLSMAIGQSRAQDNKSSHSDIVSKDTSTKKIETTTRGGPSSAGGVWGRLQIFENKSGNTGIADARRYVNLGHGHKNLSPGGDIGFLEISRWLSSARVGLLGNWEVAVGPFLTADDVSGGDTAGMAVEEQNPVNNGPDIWPWTEFDSRKSGNGLGVPPVYASGQNEVCETWKADGNYGGNCEIGVAILAHSLLNSRPAKQQNGSNIPTAKFPYPARWYTGFLVGNNSIAPGGRGIYLGGSDVKPEEVKSMPYSPLETRYLWQHGITTSLATFKDGNAFDLGQDQAIAWNLGGESITLKASNHNGARTLFLDAPSDGIIDIKGGTIKLIGKVTIVNQAPTESLQNQITFSEKNSQEDTKPKSSSSMLGGGSSLSGTENPQLDKNLVRVSLDGTKYEVPDQIYLVRLMQEKEVDRQSIMLRSSSKNNDKVIFQNWGRQIKKLAFTPMVEGWTNGDSLRSGDELALVWDGQAHRWEHFRVR
jgi:hypothetical protein